MRRISTVRQTSVAGRLRLKDGVRAADTLGDTTLTMAILDRLAMHAVRVDIKGPSYRKHVGDKRARTPIPTPDA